MDPRPIRIAFRGGLSLAILAVYLSGAGATGAAELLPEPSSLGDSHARMLAALRDIYERTDEENPWLGEAPARRARAALLSALEEKASPVVRWRLLLQVAEEELRLGNEAVAIERFREAHRLLPELGEEAPRLERLEALFQLGVAYLRHAETQNCALRHNAESCILPIRGGGIHAQTEGSREAIRTFRLVLSEAPRTSMVFIKTVWLLNIAHMTLGDHPRGLESQYRIPIQTFGGGEDFPRFENVAPRLGLDTFNLSGGAVFDDLDGDSDLDLFTTTFDARGEPRLFVNQGDGTFRDRTEEAGLRGLYGGLNVAHADYDNDGDVDLYVLRGAWLSRDGRHPNSLLRNDGSARFSDVTFAAGLGEAHYPTQTAAWADYDNDGDLDLYVGNEHDPVLDAPCQLFRNNGDGTFTDVAREAGVAVRAYVKGVVWGDYDEDRFPDLYVSVLGGANRLFRNDRDGTFTDVARDAGVEQPTQSFPVWFWDYDNDGHLDLYVSSYRGSRDGVALVASSYLGFAGPWELARLYRGDGRGGFEDVAPRLGLTRLHLPMGSNYGDLDNDGFLDFYLGTGYPDYEAVMPNVLYRNRAGERFVDVTIPAGFGHLQKGHAVVFADFDGDGDLDVFEQMGGAFPGDRFGDALYENPGFDNRWVALDLVGTVSNRSALGARIRVDLVENGRRRSVHRHVSSGGSFGGNPLRQTLGLGQASTIERLEIYWPTSDTTQTFTDVEVDRTYRVIERRSELLPVGSQVPAGGKPP